MVYFWYVYNRFVVGLWYVCGRYIVGMWYFCGMSVVGLWYVCGRHASMYIFSLTHYLFLYSSEPSVLTKYTQPETFG